MDFNHTDEALRQFQGTQLNRGRPAPSSSSLQEILARASRAIQAIGTEVINAALMATREFVSEFGAAMPANWLELTNPQIFAAVQLMEETGWSLVWTPPAETVAALLEAAERDEQREILLNAEGRILADLDTQLERIKEPALSLFREPTKEALEAYRSGYFHSSQALSAAILSSVFHGYFEEKRFGQIRTRFLAANRQEAPIREFRWIAVQTAMAQALDDYDPVRDEPSRPNFNRHATAHRVKQPQYRQVNALTSLMLNVALLVELEQLPPEGTAPEKCE